MTTALILAGKRDGALDPLAAAAGVTHKCFAPVAGRPMIHHVMDALCASSAIKEIIVSIDDPDALTAVGPMHAYPRSRLRLARAQPNLVDSVAEALLGCTYPVLITTADNVLLTPASVAQIDGAARAAGADVAIAFARRADVLAAHPDGQRRFYRFSDDAYSNCNAYWLRDARALRAAEVFREGGQFAKHPGRIVQAFGLVNLIRFRFGLGALDGLMARLSRRFRLAIRPVILDDGATAIDVDNARTQAIAQELLFARKAAGRRADAVSA